MVFLQHHKTKGRNYDPLFAVAGIPCDFGATSEWEQVGGGVLTPCTNKEKIQDKWDLLQIFSLFRSETAIQRMRLTCSQTKDLQKVLNTKYGGKILVSLKVFSQKPKLLNSPLLTTKSTILTTKINSRRLEGKALNSFIPAVNKKTTLTMESYCRIKSTLLWPPLPVQWKPGLCAITSENGPWALLLWGHWRWCFHSLEIKASPWLTKVMLIDSSKQ